MVNEREPILVIRAKGPRTAGNRIGLAELLLIGGHIQAAVERVARVLSGDAQSSRPGRKPKGIATDCALEVVAMAPGSFDLALDLPREHFDALDVGLQAVQHLLEGLDRMGRDTEAPLPAGYDSGVLHSLRDLGKILNGQITALEFSASSEFRVRTVSFTKGLAEQVDRRIRSPVKNSRTIEGCLLMADFGQTRERCRVHPPIGEPVICVFGEDMEEDIHELLRSQVRITGEAEEDPVTGRIKCIHIADIEPIMLDDEDLSAAAADTFWDPRDLASLAAEQGVGPVTDMAEVLGGAAGLWDGDDDFVEFLAAAAGRGG